LDISFELQTNATAGINVFKSGDEETSIFYNASERTVSLDRRKSGDTSFHKDFASIETVQLPASMKK
jgi:fructan beta-fructosidase